MNAPRDTRGIPPELYDEIAPLLGVDRMGYPIDPWSALGRPGSWEWGLPAAEHGRDRLEAAGFLSYVDPAASWRRVWRRASWRRASWRRVWRAGGE